ncbi:MAG: patatin-like phospholipase family protein [Crocinitomicaceae bacterium]|nr:patatin-like phospholipase family protein [Crocinitomicaceae bacterium]MBK8924730.1 patatin-like phospholipase family protein [Crocinitomicaceae bacterium]
MLILLWLIMFGFITQNLGMKLGLPYLFLSPEYLGKVNWLSFMILGFSVGGFFMAYHLYSYIMLGPYFPFIATLSRPFYKFCVNNSVIPTIFYITAIWNIYDIQANEELRSTSEIIVNLISYTGGIILFIAISVYYFFKTNVDFQKMRFNKKKNLHATAGTLFTKRNYWFESHDIHTYQPSYYFSSLIKVHFAREAKHYDRHILREVFKQNHLNASFFEVAMIISFLMLGIFQDFGPVQIPSGASAVLLFTVFLMVITIFYSWFRGWALTVIVLFALLLNFISSTTGFLQPKNFAYGLSYANKAEYTLESLTKLQFDTVQLESDTRHQEAILERWYSKASASQNKVKPKLVIVNCSGGGLRSAMWTTYVLQQLDKKSNGEFFHNVHMITGASGGMIGASYYRELYYQSKTDTTLQLTDSVYLDKISRDLLNSVAFNLASHDIFLRFKKKKIDGKTYLMDRGYAFEQQLNFNTDSVLDKPFDAYVMPEFLAEIPQMIFTPTIINDGRRMVIATQPMAFLNGTAFNTKSTGPENIEYIKLFEDNQAFRTRFTSILRMNSTFPYVLPMVSMPTAPEVQVMDAGIRDNYGTKTTVRFIAGIEEWLAEHTSGVIIVEIRDINKDYDLESTEPLNLFQRITKPLGNFYGNFHHSQEYNATELIEGNFGGKVPVETITFILRKDLSELISLSWHLTQREKNDIRQIFKNKYNQSQVTRLFELLNLY